MTQSESRNLVLQQSRGKIMIGVALSAGMLAAGIWLIFQGDPQSAKGAFARYVATPIFALVFLTWLKALIMPARLILSPAGIELKMFPGAFRLAWDQVTGVNVVNPWWTEYVAINVAGAKKTKNLPPAWERKPAEMAQLIRDGWTGAPAPAAAEPSPQPAIVS